MDELLSYLGPLAVLAVMVLGGASVSRGVWRVRRESDPAGGMLMGRGVPRQPGLRRSFGRRWLLHRR